MELLEKEIDLKEIEENKRECFYEHIFSNKKSNLSSYERSMFKGIEAIMNSLEERDTPFTGVEIHHLKEIIDAISFDNFKSSHSLDEVLQELKKIYLNDCVHFHHPKYIAHLNCPILTPTLVAEAIISSINSSMDTWDQSIGGTLIELKLIEWTLNLIGYGNKGEGIFTSGGTQSNLMGLLLARDYFIRKNYDIDPKIEGLPFEANKFKVFCSEVSHFSLKKNLSLLGLGQNAVVPVAVDENFKMDIESLQIAIEKEKKKGNIPIAIVGTAGTTDFGSIDPLTEIGKIAQENNLWFHVDAAYGGGLLICEELKEKLLGISLSDSVTIDFHKTFYQPVSSSGFFMRDSKFIDYIKYHADYLNSKEQEEEGIPNMVKKSIQTTRRFDALKLWFTLRIIGVKGLSTYLTKAVSNATFTANYLKQREDFEILHDPEISAIVFRYKPNLGDDNITYCMLNSYIRKAIFKEGNAIITSTKVKEIVYLKFTLLNPLTTQKDIQEVIELIVHHGQEYSLKN